MRVEMVGWTTVGTDVTARSYARGMARYVPEPDSPSLFDAAGSDGSGFVDDPSRPLADRLRPRALDDVVGQDQLLAPGAPLGRMVASGRLSSIILLGPVEAVDLVDEQERSLPDLAAAGRGGEDLAQVGHPGEGR